MEAAFHPGETVLVHGGASGVGTAAIQLVKAAGGTIITTAGKPEKVAAGLSVGADRAINYNEEDFVQAARAFTGALGWTSSWTWWAGLSNPQHQPAEVKGRLVWIATLAVRWARLTLAS